MALLSPRETLQFGDLRGGATMEEWRLQLQSDRLHELVGLSPDVWAILGYHLGGAQGNRGEPFSWATVWAAPREDVSYDNWETASVLGAKTVRAHVFTVDHADAGIELLRANRSWSVSLLHRSLAQLGLDLEDPA